jgi:hypothetical protein
MDTIEGFTFEKEGFYNFNPNPVNKNDVKNNIQTLQQESNNLNYDDSLINANYYDLSKNIANYNTLRQNMKMDISNSYYNDIAIPDNTDKIKTTYDVRKQDVNVLLLQQNYIYILGSVTCATLLIGALMISRS